jgi:hypothetical protein
VLWQTICHGHITCTGEIMQTLTDLLVVLALPATILFIGHYFDEKDADKAQAAQSKALSKLDPIEAANILACIEKFGGNENMRAMVGNEVRCYTKRGHFLGKL